MKASKFPDAQKALFLKQGDDGMPVAEICRKAEIWPGKPADNGSIDASNSKLRAECLNAPWFLTLASSREKLETRRSYYTRNDPHSAIGYNVQIALHNPGGGTSQPS